MVALAGSAAENSPVGGEATRGMLSPRVPESYHLSVNAGRHGLWAGYNDSLWETGRRALGCPGRATDQWVWVDSSEVASGLSPCLLLR